MKKFKVGLQLYSIRDEMEKNMDAALKRVKEIGYDYVEFAGFFDHSAQEVKEMLNRYDLECVSVHQGPECFLNEGQKAVDFLKVIGAKYCAIPHYDVNRLAGTPGWEETVKNFTEAGKLLKQNGIQQLYHNHDFEFNKADGKFLLDWLYETIPAEYLQPQIDTCWVHYAGYDPVKYLLKYAGRIKVVHLKDFVCEKFGNGPVYELIGKADESNASRDDNGFRFRPVGHGVQNMPAILEAADKAGAEIVIVEQDLSYDQPSMEAAKESREYLKNLGL